MWKTIKVDKALMLLLADKLSKHCRYKLGAKAPKLGCDSGMITHLDCSGFVRYLVHRISGVILPDGSANQLEWCESQKFKRSTYDAGGAGRIDGRLRIAFIRAYRGRVGHVWLIWDGQTIESYGGKGVGRRPWNTPSLTARCEDVFVLTEPLEEV